VSRGLFGRRYPRRGSPETAASCPTPAHGSDEAPLQVGLGALTNELAGLLAPVSPPRPFRDSLGRELAAVARYKSLPEVVVQEPSALRRGLLIGALVSSAVSVAGVIALLWRRRTHHETPRAS